ncbi:MAG TPA: efflux RND transporter periplasmic adaptor subunit [Verrucomicrobiota bacterium]|nr:hypothetical protein [Verrucomicrobiales bacterium]HRI11771.1 efflux RND transporter periplasmic adaptor subunit [Verrucomicrobiota bacterium]
MRPFLLAAVALFLLAGCKRPEESTDRPETGHAHHHEGEAEPPSGASYKNGEGVRVEEETKELLGLETIGVAAKPLVRNVQFVVQAFPATRANDPARWQAIGLISKTVVTGVEPGQEVVLRAQDGKTFKGKVKSIGALQDRVDGETEVVVEFPNPTPSSTAINFLHATLSLPASASQTVVPESALLRTAEGTFVYAVNGNAFQRVAVKTGTQADGFVEITEGLLEGDSVVTRPVEILYLVELRATKGGGHSH